MKRLLYATLAFALAAMAISAFAQDKHDIEITPLNDHIYKLSYDGGGYTVKVIASVGDDGVLLVDAGQKQAAEELKAALTSIRDEPPRIIISTHSHVEHVGGNDAFGGAPLIIGHRNIRTTLRSGIYLFDEFSDQVLPDITFDDSLSIHFNGEEIKIMAFPGAHSNDDVLVWFTGSKIACVGALCNGFDFPSVDSKGDVTKYAEITGRVIEALPDDAMVIPGHGQDCTMDDFRAFHDMLVRTGEIVRQELDRGKDASALQQEKVLSEWESFGGSYTTTDRWIKYLAEGFTGKDTRPTAYEPMYYAIRDIGAVAAVDHYFSLRVTQPETYRFTDNDIVFIAYKLYKNDRVEESLPFFERAVVEYPDGMYAELCFSYLGEAYYAAGDTTRALSNYRKVLELNPDNTDAAEIVDKLGGK
ncbi:MAG: tetratricopeptide repeat protein [Candidatus Zixiibacteriota bacterium]|nr:MAG: tetratricopeptide repeat protein [candidate division Zixibacteria bacterium]